MCCGILNRSIQFFCWHRSLNTLDQVRKNWWSLPSPSVSENSGIRYSFMIRQADCACLAIEGMCHRKLLSYCFWIISFQRRTSWVWFKSNSRSLCRTRRSLQHRRTQAFHVRTSGVSQLLSPFPSCFCEYWYLRYWVRRMLAQMMEYLLSIYWWMSNARLW